MERAFKSTLSFRLHKLGMVKQRFCRGDKFENCLKQSKYHGEWSNTYEKVLVFDHSHDICSFKTIFKLGMLFPV